MPSRLARAADQPVREQVQPQVDVGGVLRRVGQRSTLDQATVGAHRRRVDRCRPGRRAHRRGGRVVGRAEVRPGYQASSVSSGAPHRR